jgi:predicted small lipoprotein YifL
MLLVSLSLGGCGTSGPVNPDCNFRPLYLDPADVLTERTLRDIIAHNEKGETLCGWKPPK